LSQIQPLRDRQAGVMIANAISAVEALADPLVRSRIVVLGYDTVPRERQTPETLAGLQKADAEKWWPIIKELGIKAD
jgi:hypothetical protein